MFKRNQVVGAIAAVLGLTKGPGDPAPSSELELKLRRLLDIDREIGASAESELGEMQHYAFFTGDPPGRGVEVLYAEAEAFALLIAVQLLNGGFPQATAVRFVRRFRNVLETEHARIRGKAPEELLDHEATFGLEREIKLGFLVREPANMVFLAVPVGEAAVQTFDGLVPPGMESPSPICASAEALAKTIAERSLTSRSPILAIELVNAVHQLGWWLKRIPPTKRGRK